MRNYVLLVVMGFVIGLYSVFLAETQLDKAVASLGSFISIVGAVIIHSVDELLKDLRTTLEVSLAPEEDNA